jgi:hypothetical protein
MLPSLRLDGYNTLLPLHPLSLGQPFHKIIHPKSPQFYPKSSIITDVGWIVSCFLNLQGRRFFVKLWHGQKGKNVWDQNTLDEFLEKSLNSIPKLDEFLEKSLNSIPKLSMVIDVGWNVSYFLNPQRRWFLSQSAEKTIPFEIMA